MKRLKLSSAAVLAEIQGLPFEDQNNIKLETITKMVSEYSEDIYSQLSGSIDSIGKYLKESGKNLKELVNEKIPSKVQPYTNFILDKIDQKTERYSNNPVQAIRLLSRVFKANDFEDLFLVADTNISEFANAFGTTRDKANIHLMLSKASLGILLYELKMSIWVKIVAFFKKLYMLTVEASFLRIGGWLFVAWLVGVIFGEKHIKNFLMKSMMLVVHVPLAIISDIAVGFKYLIEVFSEYTPSYDTGPFISRIGSR